MSLIQESFWWHFTKSKVNWAPLTYDSLYLVQWVSKNNFRNCVLHVYDGDFFSFLHNSLTPIHCHSFFKTFKFPFSFSNPASIPGMEWFCSTLNSNLCNKTRTTINNVHARTQWSAVAKPLNNMYELRVWETLPLSLIFVLWRITSCKHTHCQRSFCRLKLKLCQWKWINFCQAYEKSR